MSDKPKGFDAGCDTEQAVAWLNVMETLSEVTPLWRNLDAVGTMAACKAIRNLKEQADRTESAYLSAVRGRKDFRDALRKERTGQDPFDAWQQS